MRRRWPPPERLKRLSDVVDGIAFMYVPDGDGFVLQPECRKALAKFKKRVKVTVGKARRAGRRDLVSLRQREVALFVDGLRQKARGYGNQTR